MDRALGTARPNHPVGSDHVFFGGPWNLVPWPKQGAVSLFGGPGSGKSSIAALTDPSTYLTREQEPKPVGAMFRRILGRVPPIHVVDTPEQVRQILSQIHVGPIALDSLTAFGLMEALEVAQILVEWCRRNNDRSLAIIQINSRGESHGYMEIPHLFDCNVFLGPDQLGIRTFSVTKSRWCPEESTYWTFDENGKVAIPTFQAAYSVEGLPGNYYLHPYPMRGAKWSHLLDLLASTGHLETRVASAAIVAPYMPHGFLVPMDHVERRRFAERNGVRWIDPSDEEIREALETAKTRPQSSKPTEET
jgi:hypothetical protein